MVAERLGTDSPLLRDAILSGVQGSELKLIQTMNRIANGNPSTNSHSTISKLAELIYREGSPARISGLVDFTAQQTNRPLQTALLKGMSDALPKTGQGRQIEPADAPNRTRQ